mgnify:FL=1
MKMPSLDLSKGTPPKRKSCSICHNKKGKINNAYCMDSIKHPTFAERYDVWDDLTYLLCWAHIRYNKMEDNDKISISS